MRKVPKHYAGAVVLPLSKTAADLATGYRLGSGAGPLAGSLAALTYAAATRYNKDMENLASLAHYSDRNADRMIRNVGQGRISLGPVQFPLGHLGSPENPIQLDEVLHTVQVIPRSFDYAGDYFYASGKGKKNNKKVRLTSNKTPALNNEKAETEVVPEVAPEGGLDPNNEKPNNEKPKGRLRRALDALRGKDALLQNNSSIIKSESAKIGKNLGRLYGNVLKGSAYALGVAPIAATGYGIYRAVLPTPTSADTMLNALNKLLEELLKLEQIERNNMLMDSIRKRILNRVGNPTNTSTTPIDTPAVLVKPLQQTDTTTFDILP